jgi:diguanylate cyclase (GGDEF)-like protein
MTRRDARRGLEPLVLVADDDPDIRELVAMRLRAAGYDVVTARDGEEALSRAFEERPDLLLLDISMPGLDGLEVCRRIQRDGPTAPPVIFLTARAHPAGAVEGLEAGATDYVTKPFRPAELLARVNSALRAKAIRDAFAFAATTDDLTGILNRRGLDVRAEETVELARRYHRPLACLMIDVDHFKRVNDEHGHAAGDAVLRQIADRLRMTTRISDIVARYGGEEFVVVLPETAEDNAVVAAEKIRSEISSTPMELPGTAGRLGVNVSIGVAEWAEPMVDALGLFAAADRALYQAKRLGRDRVAVAPRLAPAA